MQLRDKLIEYKEVYTPTSESNLDSSFFFFTKLTINLSAILLLGIYLLKGNKDIWALRDLYVHIHRSIIYERQKGETLLRIDWWRNRHGEVCILTEHHTQQQRRGEPSQASVWTTPDLYAEQQESPHALRLQDYGKSRQCRQTGDQWCPG